MTAQYISPHVLRRTQSVRCTSGQGRGVVSIAILALLWISSPMSTRGAEQTVQVRSVDDAAARAGTLTELTPQNAVIAIDADQLLTVSRRELRSIRLKSDAVPTPGRIASRWHVQLTNGDRLSGNDLAITDDALQMRVGESALSIPLEFIRGWRYTSTADEEDALRDRRVTRLTVAADTLLLVNDDRLAGELLAWDATGLHWRTAAGEQTVPADQTACVLLDSTLTSLPEPLSEWALVQTHNGSRLSIRSARIVNRHWQFDLLTGAELMLPWDDVRHIDFFGERIQPLTAQPPARIESTPYLSLAAGHEVDRNVLGGPLSLRGDVAAWGVGASSGSRLVWLLEPGWTLFETTVGLDDAADGEGSADFIVRLDGMEVARSGVLTGRDPPQTLGPFPLHGARELELQIEYADRGDIGDVANWFRPVLLK